ncbi:putative iron-regulated membrane protein [Prosthecobacter fusiformis]|uniref:Putative iron-regulated membrane protein n=1 Tax=Prosthecobacter fusiformis TaxID=48464 RepID=A0A4R7S3K4_9BACT|nr:PepSY-associated TM helix domain-containing protein [Prosthecobacter fusiformis]TDU72854.1 putative iron-regulated membrane protein [Prosthecobacter fusiformis]
MHLTFHRTIFWVHLISGLIAGIVIMSMSVTGLLIAYETQLMEWVNRDLRVTPPAANAVHLDVETLLAKVRETKPGFNPSGITWKGDPEAPMTLSLGREGAFFINPYTGEVLGEGNHTWHDFFHAATDWHRFLSGTGLSRDVGKMLTGAGTLVFGILLVSGIYLWWPKHWRWSNLRAVTLFNRKLKGRARDWNWHNVIGFWSAFPMLFIILTGLIMSYSWANNLLYRATGNEPPPPRTRTMGTFGGAPQGGMAQSGSRPEGGPRGEGGERRSEGGTRGEGGERRSEGAPRREGERPAGAPGMGMRGERPAGPPPSLTGLAPLLAQARAQVADWTSMSLRMPLKPGDPFPLMVDRGGRGQVHLRTMFNLDVAQQKVIESPDNLSNQNLGRRLRMYSRYLHTGELFGFWGQTVAALCTLAGAMLVWTGFALAWRRFFKRKNKTSAA